MDYEVISRFYDRERSRYVDPGAPCPELDEETATRLIAAGCLVPAKRAAPTEKPPRTKSKRTRTSPTSDGE